MSNKTLERAKLLVNKSVKPVILHKLNKLANMGSGICFPFLALTVYIAAVIGVRAYLTHHLARSVSLEEAAKVVYVYGDDVIVPTGAVQAVVESFKKFGLAVNTDKSYFTGFFRESCGADYYHGTSVAPTRLRLAAEGLGTVQQYRNGFMPVESDSGLLQLERHCRELVDNGLQKTADYYYSLLERKFGALPVLAKDSPAIGRYNPWAFPRADLTFEVYVPFPVKVRTPGACGYKGLGRALNSQWGLGDDFLLTPLRRSIVLKRKVLESSNIYCYGDPLDPRASLNLASAKSHFEVDL